MTARTMASAHQPPYVENTQIVVWMTIQPAAMNTVQHAIRTRTSPHLSIRLTVPPRGHLTA